MTTTVLAMEFENQAAADRHAERMEQEYLDFIDNLEKGKTDDAALKEAILSIYLSSFYSREINQQTEEPLVWTVASLRERGITHERLIQGLENIIIQEALSTFEEGEKAEELFMTGLYVAMLGIFPDYDLLPILQKCLNSKNEKVRVSAQKGYDFIMEKAQEPPKEELKEKSTFAPVAPPSSKITTAPQPEPPPPVIANEAAQPISKIPPQQPEKPSSNKPLLLVAAIALLAIIGGVVAWRTKHPTTRNQSKRSLRRFQAKSKTKATKAGKAIK